MLLSAAADADWITLDLTGLLTLLACWALGVGFAVAALTFAVNAVFARSPRERPRNIRRAALSALLAPGLGLLLPVLLAGRGKASAGAIDVLAILWAPTLAAVAGFAVYQIGRKD